MIGMIYDKFSVMKIKFDFHEREREREDPNNFPQEISVNPLIEEVECYQALSHLDKLIS